MEGKEMKKEVILASISAILCCLILSAPAAYRIYADTQKTVETKVTEDYSHIKVNIHEKDNEFGLADTEITIVDTKYGKIYFAQISERLGEKPTIEEVVGNYY